VLDALPLTVNGKIDRDALPAPDAVRQTTDAYAPPQTDLQRRLTTIWRELLGVERIGLDDNFFDLGGHSLLVVQLHSRLRDAVPDAPSVVDLFKFSTVRALADHLGGRAAGDAATPTVDLVRERADRQREAFKRRRRQAGEAGVNVE
jgi:Phosphopantetheine attachment site